MRFYWFLVIVLVLGSCVQDSTISEEETNPVNSVSLIVLGNVQDAGSPHIGCTKDCCKDVFKNPDKERKVVSLGLVDPANQKSYIIDATPDFPEQAKILSKYCSWDASEASNGIFLTHAHIGHYTGLMYLGREARGASEVPVYAMPKMKSFLEQNGPWSQLVTLRNISVIELGQEQTVLITPTIQMTPFLVPHRDEYSETVGYRITGPNKSALFIPDIDKWSKWERSIVDEIAKVDYAFLDASFFDGEEIGYRDISEIPHPFVVESMVLFQELPDSEKNKIYFIHLNHTNPLLISDSPQTKEVLSQGYNVARFNDIFAL